MRKVVAIHRGRRRALGPDPDVLNRTAFEHPSKMAFSIPFLNCAVVEGADRVHFPASNQPSIQVHVFRSVGWGTFGSESGEKPGNLHRHTDFLFANRHSINAGCQRVVS
jgi:hypothetical protein